MFDDSRKPAEITTSPDGFTVDGLAIAWVKVAAIKAFKLADPDEDRIGFTLELEDDPPYLQIFEGAPGFAAFADELASRFSFQPDWRDAVAQAPPEVRETQLYPLG